MLQPVWPVVAVQMGCNFTRCPLTAHACTLLHVTALGLSLQRGQEGCDAFRVSDMLYASRGCQTGTKQILVLHCMLLRQALLLSHLLYCVCFCIWSSPHDSHFHTPHLFMPSPEGGSGLAPDNTLQRKNASMQVLAPVSPEATVPAVLATQTLLAYTMDSFTASIQSQVHFATHTCNIVLCVGHVPFLPPPHPFTSPHACQSPPDFMVPAIFPPTLPDPPSCLGLPISSQLGVFNSQLACRSLWHAVTPVAPATPPFPNLPCPAIALSGSDLPPTTS